MEEVSLNIWNVDEYAIVVEREGVICSVIVDSDCEYDSPRVIVHQQRDSRREENRLQPLRGTRKILEAKLTVRFVMTTVNSSLINEWKQGK